MPAGLGLLAGSVVMLGSGWPLTKVALRQGAGALWFAEGRAVLSGVAAFVFLAALRRMRLPGRRDLPALALLGLLQLAGFFALAHAGAALVPAGRTAILSNTTVMWVVPLSLLVLHEAMPWRRWLAAGLGLLGALVLMNPWTIDWTAPGVLQGHLLLLGASLSWALAIVGVRRWPPRLSMLELLPWCFALASVALAPLVLSHPVGHWPPAALGCLAIVGLLAGPVGSWCVMQMAATLPATVAATGFLATPAAGLALSVVWLGEALDAGLLAGSALILAGVALGAWPAGRR